MLELIAYGKTGKEMSADFAISCNTVDTHRKKTPKKLELRNTAELVRFAAEACIIT